MKNMLARKVWWAVLAFPIIYISEGCSVFSDRTTTVYGKVTDDKGRPVEGMEVVVEGGTFSHTRHMATVQTDSAGQYEVIIEVAGKFHRVDCFIEHNAIYARYALTISGYDTYSHGKERSCCRVDIGNKTNLDFHLRAK